MKHSSGSPASWFDGAHRRCGAQRRWGVHPLTASMPPAGSCRAARRGRRGWGWLPLGGGRLGNPADAHRRGGQAGAQRVADRKRSRRRVGRLGRSPRPVGDAARTSLHGRGGPGAPQSTRWGVVAGGRCAPRGRDAGLRRSTPAGGRLANAAPLPTPGGCRHGPRRPPASSLALLMEALWGPTRASDAPPSAPVVHRFCGPPWSPAARPRAHLLRHRM